MRVFISQPMAGRKVESIQAERDDILNALRKECDDIVEVPSFYNEAFKKYKNNLVYLLSMSIKMLADADLAVFAPGWEKARGCNIEHIICREYGIPLREFEDNGIHP